MYGFYAFTGGREHFIFFLIEIENFRAEGKILMRHTHDTTFSEKILDFYKILEESEQFFILFFLKKMENLRRFFSICMSKHVGITLSVFLLVLYTGARGTDHPPFSNFLFANLFSIKFLYFFIISSLFPYFNLFVSFSLF